MGDVLGVNVDHRGNELFEDAVAKARFKALVIANILKKFTIGAIFHDNVD